MSAGDLLALLSVVLWIAALISLVLTVRREYRRDPQRLWKTVRLIGLYCLYVGAGILMLIASVNGPQPPDKAAAATIFMLTWIGYGALWLVRTAPRERPLPRWIGNGFTLLDYAIVAVVVLAGASFLVG